MKSIPGPNKLAYEISLRKHNIYRSDAHGGGFTGKNAYTLFQSSGVCDFLAQKKWKLNGGDELTLGSDYAKFRIDQHIENIVKELKLSSYAGSLCEHEKKSLEILIAENGRERSILFTNHIPLRSDHYRAHLLNQLIIMGDLIPSERETERKNQHILKIQRNITSKIPNHEIRAGNVFFRAALYLLRAEEVVHLRSLA